MMDTKQDEREEQAREFERLYNRMNRGQRLRVFWHARWLYLRSITIQVAPPLLLAALGLAGTFSPWLLERAGWLLWPVVFGLGAALVGVMWKKK